MKRTLIIVFELLVLYALVQTPFVQSWLEHPSQAMADWLSDFTSLTHENELSSLRESLLPYSQEMKPYEKDYLDSVLEDKEKLKNFYNAYCRNDDKNPFVYGEALVNTCYQIEKRQTLLQ